MVRMFTFFLAFTSLAVTTLANPTASNDVYRLVQDINGPLASDLHNLNVGIQQAHPIDDDVSQLGHLASQLCNDINKIHSSVDFNGQGISDEDSETVIQALNSTCFPEFDEALNTIRNRAEEFVAYRENIKQVLFDTRSCFQFLNMYFLGIYAPSRLGEANRLADSVSADLQAAIAAYSF
ncbi:hypothetical protein D9758_014694 [Tetrapyrgos nigripes]|uniref:Uncharacterized protein n=1 Tax=Tetrapyrgos nigripes TaxID=182062 RepID=A0A8H5CMP6_9AGAR|nr:hypothetical protein D9758_014694 [Tetrapyrgos nigripes]